MSTMKTCTSALIVLILAILAAGCQSNTPGIPPKEQDEEVRRLMKEEEDRIRSDERARIEIERQEKARLEQAEADRLTQIEKDRLDRERAERDRAEAAAKAEQARRDDNARRIANQVLSRFPINANGGGRVDVGGRRRSFWVNANVTVSKSGRVDVVHTVETKEAFAGFTGGALIRFKDSVGNIVADIACPPRGVNGTALPGGAPSRRVDTLNYVLGPEAMVHIAQIEILALPRPQDSARQITDNLNKARRFAEENQANWEMIAAIIAAGG